MAEGLKDKVRDIIVAYSKIYNNDISAKDIAMVEARMSKCPECVQLERCIHCGCKIPEKMFSEKATCPLKRW